MRQIDVVLPDGRMLRAYDAGTGGESGLALAWHHGSPQTGAPLEPVLAAAASRGIRVFSYARPSYGGSDPLPGRDVASAAADAVAVADALGIERFAAMGASGGGPHALAAAALFPRRIVGVVTLAGIAPFSRAVRLVRRHGLSRRHPVGVRRTRRACRVRGDRGVRSEPVRRRGLRGARGRVVGARRRRRALGGIRPGRSRRRRRGVRLALGLRARGDLGARARGAGRARSGGAAGARQMAGRPAPCTPNSGCGRKTATSRCSTRCRPRWTG